MTLRRWSIMLVAVALVGGVVVGNAAATPVSAAQAQYTPVAPITKHKPSSGVKGATGSKSKSGGPAQVKTSGLPFTGMSLLLPLVLSLVLIGTGVGLRRRFRPRSSQP